MHWRFLNHVSWRTNVITHHNMLTYVIRFKPAWRGLHNSRRTPCLLEPCNMFLLIVFAATWKETHLGRGWTPAEPEWGAPLLDGRRAGAGWSPHWCTRCSRRARRRWRRRTGARCEEQERARWVIRDHTALICTFEKKRWITPMDCGVERWLLCGGERRRSDSHRKGENRNGSERKDREGKYDYRNLCLFLSESLLTHILLLREAMDRKDEIDKHE